MSHFDEKRMLILLARPAPAIFALGKTHQHNIRGKNREGADGKRRDGRGNMQGTGETTDPAPSPFWEAARGKTEGR